MLPCANAWLKVTRNQKLIHSLSLAWTTENHICQLGTYVQDLEFSKGWEREILTLPPAAKQCGWTCLACASGQQPLDLVWEKERETWLHVGVTPARGEDR